MLRRSFSFRPELAAMTWSSAARHCATTNTSPPSSVKDATIGTSSSLRPEQESFLKNFREKLKQGDADGKTEVESFLPPEQQRPVSLAAVPVVAKPNRGKDRLPPWIKLQLPKDHLTRRPKYAKIKKSMREKKLATVCEEAKCPNIGECWGGGDTENGTATATIMLMGDTCTRGCRFCSIKTSRAPPPLDPNEPEKVSTAVGEMGVEYIVVTMVDRDDLPDGGAAHVAKTLGLIKKNTSVLVECLAGDFRGDEANVALVAGCGIDVYAHNIEAVERCSPIVRDRRANYRQSLAMLEHAKRVGGASRQKFAEAATATRTQEESAAKFGIPLLTKSSIMLGFDEREEEIRQALRDLRTAGVDALTLGQYLQPSSTRMKVGRYVHPQEFDMWKAEAEAMGFLYCASGPMVRSSYRAGEFYMTNILKKMKADAERAAGTDAAVGGEPE